MAVGAVGRVVEGCGCWERAVRAEFCSAREVHEDVRSQSRPVAAVMWRAAAVVLVAGLDPGVAQHPTNDCSGPLPVGTDLSTRLASGQRNLALHRAVTADSTAPGGDAAGIVDGLSGPAHRWASAQDGKPHYVIVDLAEVRVPFPSVSARAALTRCACSRCRTTGSRA